MEEIIWQEHRQINLTKKHSDVKGLYDRNQRLMTKSLEYFKKNSIGNDIDFVVDIEVCLDKSLKKGTNSRDLSKSPVF